MLHDANTLPLFRAFIHPSHPNVSNRQRLLVRHGRQANKGLPAVMLTHHSIIRCSFACQYVQASCLVHHQRPSGRERPLVTSCASLFHSVQGMYF